MANLVWEIYNACGIKYFALLILSFVVVLGYILTVTLSKKDPAYWAVLLLSLIPFEIGLHHTFGGYYFMYRLAQEPGIPAEQIEVGYAESRVSAYFGAGLSAILVLGATAGAAMKRRRTALPDSGERQSPDAR